MSLQFKTLLTTEVRDKTLLVTLNRPSVRNAINSEMMQDLLSLWKQMSNQHLWNCVILTGCSPAFCAGADLKERYKLDIKTWKKQQKILQRAMKAMLACPIPIIAAVNGAAFGGGLELVLASDFAYASTSATFSQSEVKVGLIPGAMGTQNLPCAVGVSRAKELIWTGDTLNAEQAYQYGLINKICSDDQLLNEVFKTADKMNLNSPLGIRESKKALMKLRNKKMLSGYKIEIDCYNRVLNSRDREEGIKAFYEKRKPNFNGK